MRRQRRADRRRLEREALRRELRLLPGGRGDEPSERSTDRGSDADPPDAADVVASPPGAARFTTCG